MCLMHSHQVDRFRHDQTRDSTINLSNFNVEDVEDAKTRLICMKSVSELRKLLIFPAKPVKLDKIWYPGYCQQRSKETMVNYANELSGK